MIFFELFYVFLYIGLFTFGGGYAMIPLITDEVISRGWITNDALNNFIAISESTPGPFAINIATFIGSQTGGFFGAICATIGVILPSFIIILLIAIIFKKALKNRYVQNALGGIKPIVISLILSTAILFFVKMGFYNGNDIYSQDISIDSASISILLMLSGFCILYKRKKKKSINPIMLLCICAGIGIIVFEVLKL